MRTAPSIAARATATGSSVTLCGEWTIDAGAVLEAQAVALQSAIANDPRASIDLSGVDALDTAGAWIIDRTRQTLQAAGARAELTGVSEAQATLLNEARYRAHEAPPEPNRPLAFALLGDIGASVIGAVVDVRSGLAFLGRVVSCGLRGALRPTHWRFTPLTFHLENFAFRSVPLIILINMFVGAIVAQQGIFQLERLGASAYSTELVAILSLRELGVLLSSIMVAGRTGSAITAEIGAMKMREEIDALRVMALDPIEVLVLPRVSALVIALPILTFLGDLGALFGGMCVAWIHGDVTPYSYLGLLQHPWTLERFEVGMIKAPFMALVIGIIAAAEGFAVEGSAESLGNRVTASVVKSIFMVIVLDGLFASFFVAVDF